MPAATLRFTVSGANTGSAVNYIIDEDRTHSWPRRKSGVEGTEKEELKYKKQRGDLDIMHMINAQWKYQWGVNHISRTLKATLKTAI